MKEENITNSIGSYIERVEKVERIFDAKVKEILPLCEKDIALRIHRADWHIRGLAYHTKKLIHLYGQFASSVSARAIDIDGDTPGAIIMYSKNTQELMFEFYALVNLGKITLDNLSKLLYPLFKNKHLPKSVTDYTLATTNCPVYEKLCQDANIAYLVDIRNCLVHYRSFASSDNSFVIKEGIEYDPEDPLWGDWTNPMFRATYRIEEAKVVVNVFLPDQIYINKDSAQKKLANFTYDEKINILGQSFRFLMSISGAVYEAIDLLRDKTERFEYGE